jgi:hypothetical protein
MLNDDAALAYLDYYGEDAMGISIVSPRVRAGRVVPRSAYGGCCLRAPAAARRGARRG